MKRLMHGAFFDSKALCQEIICNRARNTADEPVNWLTIKWFRFEKAKPYIVQYKSNLSSSTFMELDVQSPFRGRHGRLDALTLKTLYISRVPISLAKKNDLGRLVSSRIIPPEYA